MLQRSEFFGKHYKYIKACVTIRAWEIKHATGIHDIDDYTQNMYLYVYQHIDKYQSSRASPKTFINLLVMSAKKMILRSLRRKKNKMIIFKEQLEACEEASHTPPQYDAAIVIRDYINLLPQPQKSFCKALILDGKSANSIASHFGISAKTVLRHARKALVPLATQYNIDTAIKSLSGVNKSRSESQKGTTGEAFRDRPLGK